MTAVSRGPFGLAERDGLAGPPVPADGDHAGLGGDLALRREDRLAGGQARGAEAFHRQAHRHPPLRVADLRAEVHLDPGHHVIGLAAEGLHEERVPALLEIGQEHRVVDVPQGVRVPPPDIDRMLEYRVHLLHSTVLLPPRPHGIMPARAGRGSPARRACRCMSCQPSRCSDSRRLVPSSG